MITKEQVRRQAYDLRVLVCQNARLDGFRFDIVLDAIDRACDSGLQHIATYERICASATVTDDLEHDAQREVDLIDGPWAEQEAAHDPINKW